MNYESELTGLGSQLSHLLVLLIEYSTFVDKTCLNSKVMRMLNLYTLRRGMVSIQLQGVCSAGCVLAAPAGPAATIMSGSVRGVRARVVKALALQLNVNLGNCYHLNYS